jgi:Glycosyl transferase family 2
VTDLTLPGGPPAEITHLVRERTEARNRRDWARADVLKAEIEAAGWRVTDRGNRTSVSPATPASVAIDGEMRFGAASAVPSLLDAPVAYAWTVLVPASEQPDRVSSLLAGLRDFAPAGTQVVIVANDPSDAQVAALAPGAPDMAPIAAISPEVLRTSARLGYTAALNIGLRRAAGELVLVADGTARPTGDALGPLAAALAEGDVAAAGGFGLYSDRDSAVMRPNALRRDPSPDAAADPASAPIALEGAWLAFRRSDYIDLGPLEERFVTPAWLDVWWTLRLRAGAEPEGAEYVDSPEAGQGEEADEPEAESATDSARERPDIEMPRPRRAVQLELPLERDEVPWPPDRSRLNRRNMYRVLDRFGWREDLV